MAGEVAGEVVHDSSTLTILENVAARAEARVLLVAADVGSAIFLPALAHMTVLVVPQAVEEPAKRISSTT